MKTKRATPAPMKTHQLNGSPTIRGTSGSAVVVVAAASSAKTPDIAGHRRRRFGMHHWPLFDLVIRTPRLELRYVDDAAAAALMELAATGGVHAPDFMPFSVPWTRFEPPYLQQQGMQFFWRTRAETSPGHWALPFAVSVDGEIVGTQSIAADRFAVTRWVSTGSWLGLRHQGKGIGKEMRAAVLHLGFAGLGAVCAETSAFANNAKSLGVTRALGYTENGWKIDDREGTAAKHLHFVMPRGDWELQRRDDITVEGPPAVSRATRDRRGPRAAVMRTTRTPRSRCT